MDQARCLRACIPDKIILSQLREINFVARHGGDDERLLRRKTQLLLTARHDRHKARSEGGEAVLFLQALQARRDDAFNGRAHAALDISNYAKRRDYR